ncbi:MAG TPA: hypothetical protein VG944_10865 [Fimbriimonas sp.]|nr:hypothetical protein [Fimbriimonas sp.]
MNRVTRITFAIALNAICATVGLGLAGTAVAGGLNCSVPVNVYCQDGCGAFVQGAAFQCCSTYGTSCCARTCHQITCLQGLGKGPCNQTPQIEATAGATITNTQCVNGNSCYSGAN